MVDVGDPVDVIDDGLPFLHQRQAGRVPERRGRVVGHGHERLAHARTPAHADLEERQAGHANLGKQRLDRRNGRQEHQERGEQSDVSD